MVAHSPAAIGTIIAAVAVFEIHIENSQVTLATATRARRGEPATKPLESSHNVARRSKP